MSADEECNINATNDAKINSEVTGAQGIVLSPILQKLEFRLRIYFFDDVFLFSDENDLLMGIDRIAWPFIISGTWCVFFSLGYAVLGIENIYKI